MSPEELRELIAKVIISEGCGCCEGRDHTALQAELAKALDIPRFPDDSGYDWWAVAGK